MKKIFLLGPLFFSLGCLFAVFGFNKLTMSEDPGSIPWLAQVHAQAISTDGNLISTARIPGHVPPLPQINLFQVTVDGSARYKMPIQMDVNGDGLSDLVFSSVSNQYLQYIYTNTGGQFEQTYYCNQTYNAIDNINYFYGDCADPNASI